MPTSPRSNRILLLLLALFAAALVAMAPALLRPEWLAPRKGAGAAAWPGGGWSIEMVPEGARAIVAWRALLALLAAVLGLRVARLARALGAGGPAALAAAVTTAASSAAASLAWDRAGLSHLAAALAFTCFCEWTVAAPRRWIARAAAALVAAVASAGLLLPALAAAALALAPDARRLRTSGAALLLLAAVALAGSVRVVVGLPFASPESEVTALDASASGSDRLAALRDATGGLAAAAGGTLAKLPWIDAWRPEVVSSNAAAWVAALLLATGVALARAIPLRALALGAFAAFACAGLAAAGRPLALVAVAGVLPAVALAAAGLAATQRHAALAVAGLLVAAQAIGAARKPAPDEAAATPPALLAQLEGDARDAALERSVARCCASERDLAAALERAHGFARLERVERAGDDEAALDWIERWSALRGASRPPLPALEARRVALLLRVRGAEALAEALRLRQEAWRDSPPLRAAIANAMVDALHRRAGDAQFVAVVVPLVEELLEPAAARPGDASAPELECLALLRAGQGRVVEAVRLAEQAAAKEPRAARPRLVLARIYLGRGERDAGLREVARARAFDPDDAAALLLEGRLLCTNADLAERGVARMLAARAADPALAWAREEIEAGCVAASEALVARGRVEAARDVLGRAIAEVGRTAPLVRALAGVARQQRAFEAEVVLLEEAAAAGLDDLLRRELAEACRDAGYALLLQRDRDGALRRFERALETAPPGFDTAGIRSIVEQHRARDAAPADPAVAAARADYEEGVRLYRAGERAQAVAPVLRSIEKLPLNPYAHLLLGRLKLELGEPGDAEGALRTAIAVGAATETDVEEAWPVLLDALLEAQVEPRKLRSAVDEYLRTHPAGRYRDRFEALRER